MFNQKNVAFVITDPQVEFLKSTGKGFGATKDVLEKVNTIENLTKLFALAKERGYKRFISPHYFYPVSYTHLTELGQSLPTITKLQYLSNRLDKYCNLVIVGKDCPSSVRISCLIIKSASVLSLIHIFR